jgi:hypothetical protein
MPLKNIKGRGPNRVRVREVRRLFQAGAEKVEVDPVTGRLIGYRHDDTRTPNPKSGEQANPWDTVLNAADTKRAS